MKSILELLGKIFSWRNLFHYNNILCVGSLFLIFELLLSGVSLSFLDPVSDAFSDVDLSDMNYSYLGKNDDLRGVDEDGEPVLDTNLVIVNIGFLNRLEIATLLQCINKGNPKVVGIDAIFEGTRDSLSDFSLAHGLSLNPNTVIAGKGINLDMDTKKYQSFENPTPLLEFNAQLATANLAINSDGNDIEDYKICRKFITGHHLTDSIYDLAFAPKICSLYNPKKGQVLRNRNTLTEPINYIGNQFVDFSSQNDEFAYFKTVDFREVFMMDSLSLQALFKGKIALLGYMGNTLEDRNDDHDKFYSPLNKKYIGKADQDMFGVVIHANIIAMMLNERYIDKMPELWAHIIGAFLTYLTFAAFRPIYDDHKIWYDGGTKVLSFVYVIITFFVTFYIFDKYDYKVTISGIYIGAILLAGDYMEIYYGLFVNLFERFFKKQ